MTNGKRAGAWLRVSGDSQSEADQWPDISAYSDTQGYTISPEHVFTVHGKSAYHGAQDPYWLKVIEAFKAGEIDVIVLWTVDRLDRRNIRKAVPMVEAILQVHGRIEFSEQPDSNLDADDPDINTKFKAFTDRCHAAWQESQLKSKRVRKAHNKRRSAGAFIGRPTFGYASVLRDDGYKGLVPTDIGRKYIPAIYGRIANGASLIEVAQWLDKEGVKPNSRKGVEWSSKSLSQIIRNETYVGTQMDARGNCVHKCEALVSQMLWDQANKALDNSPRGKRGPRTENPALLSGALICGSCGGNAYRIYAGSGEKRLAYYRCSGRKTGDNTKPKGCGAPMIRVELLDNLVSFTIEQATTPIHETRFVPGTDKEGKLAELKKAIRDLDMDAENYDERYAALMAQRKSLMASEVVPDRWVKVDTGETYASRWASRDAEGKRAMLKNDARIIMQWTHEDKANGVQPHVSVRGIATPGAKRL